MISEETGSCISIWRTTKSGLATVILYFVVFLLLVAFGVILVRCVGKFIPENRGAAAEILSLSALGAKICLGAKLPPS